MTPLNHDSDVSGRPGLRRAAEAFIKWLITGSGWIAIVILAAIGVFLVTGAVRALSEVGLIEMVTGTAWFPTSDPPRSGFVPLMTGSLLVTGIALLVSVPIAIAAAVYISEFASLRLKEISKSIIEFMAAVPSVVYGLLGIALVGPWVKETFESAATGLNALTAGLVLGIMVTPTILSISEDALHAVPRSLRQGSMALGNTRWQTIYKVVLPSGSSGIFAAVMLGLGRAIGETMAVLMLAGNARAVTFDPLDPVRTMTATIAAEMGEVVQGGLHYSTLFALGLVLFTITFVINLSADTVLERQRKRWRR